MNVFFAPEVVIGEGSTRYYIKKVKSILKKSRYVFLSSTDGYTFKTTKVAIQSGKIVWHQVLNDGSKIIILVERREG